MNRLLAITCLALATAATTAAQGVVISEILYNPAGSDTGREWVEIYNAGSTPVVIGGWTIEDEDSVAPSSPIAAAATLAAGEAAILTSDVFTVANFQAAWGTGFQVFTVGGFPSLSNNPGVGNEIITIRDALGNIVDEVDYDEAPPWPTDAGGRSKSLLFTSLSATDNDNGANWRQSIQGENSAILNAITVEWPEQSAGSPGTIPMTLPPTPANGDIIISEILNDSDGPDPEQEWVEIYNSGTSSVALDGWALQDEDGLAGPIPSGTTIAAGEAIVLCSDLVSDVDFRASWFLAPTVQVIPLPGWSLDSPLGLDGLSNSPDATNEMLTLRDAAGVIQDEVNFDDSGVWPGDATSFYLAGTALTAALNDNGASWLSSMPGVAGAVTSGLPFLGADVGSPGFVAPGPAFEHDLSCVPDPVTNLAVITLSIVGGTPGNTAYFAVTARSGIAPAGWFYGIDITLGELAGQLSSPDLVQPLDATGEFLFTVPTPFLCPIGLVFDTVALEFGAGGAFVQSSAAKTSPF